MDRPQLAIRRATAGLLRALAAVALLLPSLGVAAATGSPPAQDFGLLDHQGRFHQLHRQSHRRAVVLFVQGNGCPIARKNVPALRALRDAFAARGVTFWMLNANPQDDRAAIAEEARRYDIDLPILHDEAQAVARAFGITRTAEAIVIDPDGWRIRYRGPIDDRLSYESERPVRETYLRDALEAVLAGRAVETPVRPAPGCLIVMDEPGAATPDVSYARDVAPILMARCRTCHRQGGIAPWPMRDHAMVRGWSAMMGEVLRTGRMPPWQADPRYGRFANDLSLPADERSLLLRWIDAGAPRGAGADPLVEQPAPLVAEWPLGVPDLVIEAPEQAIPAAGVVPYRYERVEVPIARDAWVTGVHLQPSNAAAMHHGLVWIRYPEGRQLPGSVGPDFTRGMLAGYVPGREARPFPKGTGYLLPAGSRLLFQLHYTATGRPEIDRPRLALYFSPAPLAHELRTGTVASFDFEIPPRAEDHEETAELVLARDIVLYRLMPHMHYRGKRMRIDALHADGREQTLISVPRYEFNWQHQYELDPPLRLQAGTTLRVVAGFDNSPRNPANPDPDAWVHYGEQSFEEMLFGYFLYREEGELATARSPADASHAGLTSVRVD